MPTLDGLHTKMLSCQGVTLYACARRTSGDLSQVLGVNVTNVESLTDYDQPRVWRRINQHRIGGVARSILSGAQTRGDTTVAVSCRMGRCRSVAVIARIAVELGQHPEQVVIELEPLGTRQRAKIRAALGLR